jgi:hypothetical protein
MDDMQPIINSSGDIVYRDRDQLHRTDGPAVEWTDGSKFWYVYNQLHRIDGPAIEYADGNISWCLNGVYLLFEGWLEQNTEISDEEKVMIKLQYG